MDTKFEVSANLLKPVIALLIIAGITFLAGCGGSGSACQLIEHSEIERVECSGSCPSDSRPNCYVRFREEGSQGEWEKSDQSTMDKTPGMEFSCYCGK